MSSPALAVKQRVSPFDDRNSFKTPIRFQHPADEVLRPSFIAVLVYETLWHSQRMEPPIWIMINLE